MDLDTRLRHDIYDVTLARGVPPTITELAAGAHKSAADIRASLARLASGRIVVLQPGSGEILMAPPFSAVPTPFAVHTSRHGSYANCAWDALGVSIMLRERAHVVTSCACCGEAMALDIAPDKEPISSDLIHFAVPAARWWQDMVFT